MKTPSSSALPDWFRALPLIALAAALVQSGTAHAASDGGLLGQPRESRFAQLVAALEQVRLSDKSAADSRTDEGFQRKEYSQVQIAFLSTLSGRENDDQDGVIVFPLQVVGVSSGLNSRRDPRGQLKSGSDFQTVRIHLQRLFADSGAPRASIDIPPLRQGSTFDAVQMARDKIVELIEWFLPECEIEGVRKFYEKRIAIDNRTDETVVVWIQRQTRERADDGFRWEWKPANPSTGQATRHVLAPRTSTTIEAGESGRGTLSGCCMRLWAESDSGYRWDTDRSQDIWLVEPDPKAKGERTYHAQEMETYTHVLEESPGSRVFSERLVEFRNATPEELTVQCRFPVDNGGVRTWETVTFRAAPGQTVKPERQIGLRVRASQILFTAVGRDRRFVKHASVPLWLVEESPAGRLYRADDMGAFVHVFSDATAPKPKETAER